MAEVMPGTTGMDLPEVRHGPQPRMATTANSLPPPESRQLRGETMITISVFNGLYCTAPQVIEELVNATGYRLVTDQDVIAKASMLSGIDASLLAGAFPTGEDNCGRTPDTGGAVGWLRLAMAHKLLERRDSIFHGYSALLLPQKMRHVLRVCLVSGIKERLMEGMRAGDCPSRELRDRIFADDMARADWAMSHTDCADPWDERFYDLVIPVSSLGARQSASRIMELLCKTASRLVGPYDESLDDFLLAATVQADLSHWGDCVSVVAKEGAVTLGFNDHAKALGGMIRDLRDIVSGIEGVESVHIGTGRSYNQADIHCRPKHWPTPGRRPDAALPKLPKACRRMPHWRPGFAQCCPKTAIPSRFMRTTAPSR